MEEKRVIKHLWKLTETIILHIMILNVKWSNIFSSSSVDQITITITIPLNFKR